MISRTPTLAEWRTEWCGSPAICVHAAGSIGRKHWSRGSVATLLMPDVRHLIAECPRKDAPGAACGVFYADLREP
jgi:hypothetical protein